MTSDHVPGAYDVFLDLSDTEPDEKAAAKHLEKMNVQCGFAHSAGHLSVLPAGVRGAAAATAWADAVAHAARRRRHLVVVLGKLVVENDTIPPLIAGFLIDPLFGTAQPRFSCAATDAVWPLLLATGSNVAGGDAGFTTRAALSRLPPILITTEQLAALTVIRWEVVSTIATDSEFASIPGALAHSLSQARRRGFRNVVANHTVIPTNLPRAELYPHGPSSDVARRLAQYPDVIRAAAENAKLPQMQLEPLLSAAYPRPGARRRLLLNCRGLGTLHNGTSKCVLGMLDGFAALNAPWDIEVAASADAVEFHGIATRYPQFKPIPGHLPGGYAAAIMLNQPWAVETAAEMHRQAFLIGFNILDTIGWDIVYPAPERLELAWSFVARHSDLLMFISGFSQDRFRIRFPVATDVAERVVHLSFLEHENADPQFQGLPEGDHVLLFGNSYDHKGIALTLRLLVEAFPLQTFSVFGWQGPTIPGVHAIPSGKVSADEVHRLVATARAVVYPSFYEGFGLPVVESLAYGRPVLVRKCSLWTEIAAQCRLPGRLIEFDDPPSLLEALGQILSGSLPAGLPFGTALATAHEAAGWREAAATVICSIEERLAEGSVDHWTGRDEALRVANL